MNLELLTRKVVIKINQQAIHLLIGLIIVCGLAACSGEGESSDSYLPTHTDQPVPTPSIPITNNLPTSASTITTSSTPDFDLYPEGLQIAYTIDNTLYLWYNGQTQELVNQPKIFAPQLSSDGEWIIYHQDFDLLVHDEEFWAIKTDGTERHPILILDDLANLIETELRVLISEFSWLPHTHTILFNTQLYNNMVDGNPYEANNDLYLLDLDGQITQIAPAGLGGIFTPSPDGRYVAVSTHSEIGLWDLETGIRQTLLEFSPLRRGCDCTYYPQLRWDRAGGHIITSIPSPFIHYPDYFGGKPEEIWRLSVNGSAEVIAQVAPSQMLNSVVDLGPNLTHNFYYDDSGCEGGYFSIHLRELESSTELRQIPCASYFPVWLPDGEHFLIKGEDWELGNINNSTTEVLEFLSSVNRESFGSSYLTWIDDTYFLLESYSDDYQTISLATLDGIVSQIIHTPQGTPAQFSISVSKD